MTVQVEVAPGTAAGAQAWGKELRTALEARTDEFRLAKHGGDRVAGRSHRLGRARPGRLERDERHAGPRGKSRPFSLNYPGEIRPQAERLARNLRKLAEQGKAGPPAAAPKK